MKNFPEEKREAFSEYLNYLNGKKFNKFESS